MKFTFNALIILFISCSSPSDKKIEIWKKEVMKAEADFAQMASEKGISIAFRTFAAEQVALKRKNKLVVGIEALKAEYSDLEYNPNVSLTWKPDFVDVSKSGDMAYTYGNYVFTRTDSLGNIESNEGVFHTVWKRQSDGSWKFVWD